MRTKIDIDDALLAEAMRLSESRTKREAVEKALRLLVQLAGQGEAFDDMGGLGWDGDLDTLREGRTFP